MGEAGRRDCRRLEGALVRRARTPADRREGHRTGSRELERLVGELVRRTASTVVLGSSDCKLDFDHMVPELAAVDPLVAVANLLVAAALVAAARTVFAAAAAVDP